MNAGRKNVLIVGAGPVGLCLGLMLAQNGIYATIIDKKREIVPYSKALGINPHSIMLLRELGVVDSLFSQGRKMQSITIWKGEKPILHNPLSKAKHPYPFMLILPQSQTERILLSAAKQKGLDVKMGVPYSGHVLEEGKFRVIGLNDSFDFLIGADGAQSPVRNSLQIPIEGFSYANEWSLYDVWLSCNLDPDQGHIRLNREGGMIMIRIKDSLWRVAGNQAHLLNDLPEGTSVQGIQWGSKFFIHHKMAKQLVKGNAAILGDAAHQHSPLGARGMNLGFADAAALAKAICSGNIKNYENMRLPRIRRTVRRVNAMTFGLVGQEWYLKGLRKHLHLLSPLLQLGLPYMRDFMLGVEK
ncbi:FAD-dependent oxidoreductase [Pleomorphovibrio marinus]|uniref:FAD-dependent oxidoreductase n=1 Tax=Pleomorphovibrio marinus TaxID=2164132 RepID=UPI000E0C300B|nr:FAD-dependent monooxygenase [Pleomorphovibrio marinus]